MLNENEQYALKQIVRIKSNKVSEILCFIASIVRIERDNEAMADTVARAAAHCDRIENSRDPSTGEDIH
jgi:hypothetical protein